MKIELDTLDKTKLEKLFEKNQANIAASDFYNEILTDEYCSLCGETDVSFSHLVSLLGYDPTDFKDLIHYNEIDKISVLDFNQYASNPYLKTVHIKPKKDKDIELNWNYYEPQELFLYDDVSLKEGAEIQKLGYFSKRLNYPYIAYKNKVWMNVTPFEINTMASPLKHAKGKVLALGLGLGYFPFMALLKKEVEEVTVVENDKRILHLFKEQILPFFPKKEKIHLVEGDAYTFVKEKGSPYDYLFADIYRNPTDGLECMVNLLPLLPASCTADFWIEKGILTLVRRIVVTLMQESLLGKKEEDYTQGEDFLTFVLNKIYFETKDLSLKSWDEVEQLLRPSSLKALLQH